MAMLVDTLSFHGCLRVEIGQPLDRINSEGQPYNLLRVSVIQNIEGREIRKDLSIFGEWDHTLEVKLV